MERLWSPQFFSGCVTLDRLLLLSGGPYFASIYSVEEIVCFFIRHTVIGSTNKITDV